MAPFKVIIIGSGLAGNLLANGLLNNNIDVEVYERLARDAKREGYQIRLGENALKGFRACLTPERKQAIISKFGRSNGKFAAAPIMYNGNFEQTLDLNRFPNYEKSAAISRKILRDLLAEPVDEAGRIFYGKGIKDYSVLNAGADDERVRVRFEDGSTSDCDILIAADGAHSKINGLIGLDNLVTLTSHMSFLAKSDLPTESYLKGDKVFWKAPIGVLWAKRAMYYCAYLPDKVRLNADAVDLKDTKQLPQYDQSISSCFFAYAAPVGEVPDDIKEWQTEKQWKWIEKDMGAHWCAKYQEIAQLLHGSDLYIYQGRVSQRPSAKWRQNVQTKSIPERGHPRVLMIGDAIHAMMPSLGMGGNQAMRDTATLLPILVQLNEKAKSGIVGRTEVENACREYEKEMMPRAFGWVDRSGGTTAFSEDPSTWMGWLKLKWIGVVLDIAYNVQRFTSLFYTPVYTGDAPEFQG